MPVQFDGKWTSAHVCFESCPTLQAGCVDEVRCFTPAGETVSAGKQINQCLIVLAIMSLHASEPLVLFSASSSDCHSACTHPATLFTLVYIIWTPCLVQCILQWLSLSLHPPSHFVYVSVYYLDPLSCSVHLPVTVTQPAPSHFVYVSVYYLNPLSCSVHPPVTVTQLAPTQPLCLR